MQILDHIRLSLDGTPGIDGRDEYMYSSVLVPLVEIEGELHFLFQERSENIRQGGEVSFPGGQFDGTRDGTGADTAVREACEELGICPGDIEILGQLDTVVSPMGTIVEAHVGFLSRPVKEYAVNEKEVSRIFTVPVSFFEETEPEKHNVMIRIFSREIDPETGEEKVYLPVEELGLPERYGSSWGAFRPWVYFFRHHEGMIWGLTARIILNFMRKTGYRVKKCL